MIAAQTGLQVDLSNLGQLSDANGKQLQFRIEGDYFVGNGSNTEDYSWTYIAEPFPDNPDKVSITVKKTPLNKD